MADPLSLLTGIIGILSAAGQASNGLQSLLALKNAPAELASLQQELNEFKVVLDRLKRLAAQDSGATLTFCDAGLDSLIRRAEEKCLEIKQLVAYTLTKPNDCHKVRRSKWLLERNNVEQHLKELQAIKSSLYLTLSITSW